MTPDVYYDRSLRSWVVIFRDGEGYGIPDPVTQETAHYFYTRGEAVAFARERIG